MISFELPTPEPKPHMVMVVNNSLHGDSRVQKSAVAATDAGFRVTILGLKIKTIESTGTVGPARVFRADWDPVYIRAWNERQGRVPIWEFEDTNEKVATISRNDIEPVFTLNAKSPIEIDSAPAPNDQPLSSELGHKAIKSLAARLGLWDELWPMTLDYISAFLPALIDLKPDLIHCHDYHPMPAVVAYVLYNARQGKKVPWVYDAHEWLPGQSLPGPTAQGAAWLAVERKLIGAADSVIAVSDVLASKMKQRHKITSLPAVVTNAPSRVHVPLTGDRIDIRTDIGLSDDVPLLVYVGKLSEVRGIYTAAQALEFLPEVHLAFVGSNSPVEIEHLRRIAAARGAEDRIHILQYVPAESVTSYVSTADIGISPLLPTEAHHSALPTKIREYLHAKLPMIVSDMREQSRFVDESGVGEVHAAGDATDFGRSVKKVLENYRQYRSNLTEELLNEHSWEKQAGRLQEVWNSIVVRNNIEVQAKEWSPSVTTYYRRSLDRNGDGRSLAYFQGNGQIDSIAEHWLAHCGDIVSMRHVPQKHLETAIDQFEQLKKHNIDLVLYRGSESVFSRGRHKKFDQEYRELFELGIDCAIYVGDTHVVPTKRIAGADPLHPLAIASSRIRGSYDRRVRLFSESFRDLPMPVFTHSFLEAAMLPQAVWLPPIVPLEEGTVEAVSNDLKVAVLPMNRSSEENSSVRQAVRELRRRGISVSVIRGRGMKPRMVRRYDILVHSLHRIDMSEATAHHMASGGVLVGARPYADTKVPFWEATQSNLVERVMDLVHDVDVWQNESEKSLAYSRDTFSAGNAVNKVMAATKPLL